MPIQAAHRFARLLPPSEQSRGNFIEWVWGEFRKAADGLEQNTLNDLHPYSRPAGSPSPQSGDNLVSGNRMLAYPHPAGVVNSVRERSRHRTNAGFAEALDSVEPAGLEAIDVLFGRHANGHYGLNRVRQVPYTVR